MKSSVILLAVAFIAPSLAAPTESGVSAEVHTRTSPNEVFVPEEGMPTLEELGLTEADLAEDIVEPRDFSPTVESELLGAEALEKRQFQNRCFVNRSGNYGRALACYNYLNALPSGHRCTVNGEGQTFCSRGLTKIMGSNISGQNSYTVSCHSVVQSAYWILNNCRRGEAVEGHAAAWGNGNVIVSVGHV